jgi:hypothetical protein
MLRSTLPAARQPLLQMKQCDQLTVDLLGTNRRDSQCHTTLAAMQGGSAAQQHTLEDYRLCA